MCMCVSLYAHQRKTRAFNASVPLIYCSRVVFSKTLVHWLDCTHLFVYRMAHFTLYRSYYRDYLCIKRIKPTPTSTPTHHHRSSSSSSQCRLRRYGAGELCRHRVLIHIYVSQKNKRKENHRTKNGLR